MVVLDIVANFDGDVPRFRSPCDSSAVNLESIIVVGQLDDSNVARPCRQAVVEKQITRTFTAQTSW